MSSVPSSRVKCGELHFLIFCTPMSDNNNNNINNSNYRDTLRITITATKKSCDICTWARSTKS